MITRWLKCPSFVQVYKLQSLRPSRCLTMAQLRPTFLRIKTMWGILTLDRDSREGEEKCMMWCTGEEMCIIRLT